MHRGLLAAILLCGSSLLANNCDFVLPLRLTNSHLGQLFLGCREGATDAYEQNIDELAPPPGIQTGYVGIISTVPNSLLYKDIKAHGDFKEWHISVQVYSGKPITLSWQKADLPKFYTLTLVTGDATQDMSQVTQVELTENQRIVIVAALDREAAAAAAAEAEATPTVAAPDSPAPPPPPPVAAPAAEPKAAPPVSSRRVTGGISVLVLAMGGLLLLVVIFAAVRRQ